MEETSLLPPSTAIQIVWTCTGTFSKDKDLRLSTFLIDEAMKDMKSLLKNRERDLKEKRNYSENDARIEDKNKDEIEKKKEEIRNEKEYLMRAKIAMSSCLRSLHTMYKGRELNFDENTKLREAYLKSLEENIDFGNKLRDFLKSLPTMTIGAAGGATVAQFISTSIKESFEDSKFFERLPVEVLFLIFVVLGFAFGYILNDLLVRWSRKRKQMLYIINDYERNVYYDFYIIRVEALLESLYTELNRIRQEIFQKPYDKENEKGEGKNTNNLIKNLINAQPKHCRYIYKHMQEKKITPGEWTICETELEEDRERCIHWRYEESIKDCKNGEKGEISEKNKISDLGMTIYKTKILFGRFWYLRLDY